MDEKMKREGQVVEGSDIMELVEYDKVFTNFVDHNLNLLDLDNDGNLSVNELQPALAHIGAALGLPPQGSSPHSDHIYSQVLNEFTHGKEEKITKSEFKEVLSDILLGMAAGLKRDPIVILRIDGQDLLEYITSPSYETEIMSIFFQVESTNGTLHDQIVEALQKLGVDQGLPPCSDAWVMSNVVEPSLEACLGHKKDQPVASQETFLVEFRKVLENIVAHLKEQPVIVAHTENTYDGSAIKTLLTNKFETDKVLNSAMATIPRDKQGRISKEYLRVALDALAPFAGLPLLGTVPEMDRIINDGLKMVDADDGKLVKEEEFKKLVSEILGSVMLQLEGNPVSVSANSVVHEPLAEQSSFLHA